MKHNYQELLDKCQAIASKLQGTFKRDADAWGFSGILTSIAPYSILVSTSKTGENVSIEDNRLIFYANLKINFSFGGEDLQLWAWECVKRSEYDQVKKEISVAASRPAEQIAHEILSRLMRPIAPIWKQLEQTMDMRLAYCQRREVTVLDVIKKFKAVGITLTPLKSNGGHPAYGDKLLYCQKVGTSLAVGDGQVTMEFRNLSLTPESMAAIMQIALQDRAFRSTAYIFKDEEKSAA